MLRTLAKLLKAIFFLILLLLISVTLFIYFAPTFGAKATGDSLEKIHASKNFVDEAFKNLIPTAVSTPDENSPFSALEFFRPPKGKNPSKPLPSQKFSKEQFKNGDFVWFGHSTVLTRTDDVNVLIDPVFYSAAPVQFLVKPFAMQVENTIADLPTIDVVLISHDHYDHLDYKAIQEIDNQVKIYLVPLGVKAHLQRWNISPDKIIEMDWYENTRYKTLDLIFTPSRHFSGRGLFDQSKTLWGSWVIKSYSLSMFFSGDSGYFDEFKKIGQEYGPFDIAFIENGAYNPNWSQIHLYPEQSVQTSIDLNSKAYFPIHWGKFDLSTHHWTDPIVRAQNAAIANNVQIVSPQIGEVFRLDTTPNENWWRSVD